MNNLEKVLKNFYEKGNNNAEKPANSEKVKRDFKKLIKEKEEIISLLQDYYQYENKEDKNWFEKLPQHWKLLSHLIFGIIIGLLITYLL